MGFRSRAADAYAQLRRGFFRRAARTLFIVAIEPLIMWLVYLDPRIERQIRRILRSFRLRAELRRWSTKKHEILSASGQHPKTSILDLGLKPDQLHSLQSRLKSSPEVLIADIDQDGFFLSRIGHIGELPTVGRDEFMPRRRFQVQLVARGNWIGVKKSYRGNKACFLNELHALHRLAGTDCRVPAILDIDFAELSVTTSFVRGDVVRERLARESALVRDRDVEKDPTFESISRRENVRKRVENGARIVERVVDADFIDDLYRQLQIVHASKILWSDFKYGNIIIEKKSGLPWLIDFDGASDGRKMNRYSFRAQCDKDVEWFNKHFNRHKWTYPRIKQRVRSREENPLNRTFYAPAYLGYGIWFGQILRIGVGFGQWNYILKDNLPPVSGKRVLDLGANNAVNAIQLLRGGAREVIALEQDERAIQQGETLRELYEWADCTSLNLHFVQGDMAALPEMELGKFDMVMALCSLYYLDPQNMRRVTEHVSKISDVFVLQGNHATGIGRRFEETYKKARIEFLEEILKTNGFEDTKILSYPGYARPLLIGRKAVRKAVVSVPHSKPDPQPARHVLIN